MNLGLVTPKSGKPQPGNVHAKDRAQLVREGFVRYRLEWTSESGGTREANVYAQRLPTDKELFEGLEVLLGSRGVGTARLLDQAGNVVIP